MIVKFPQSIVDEVLKGFEKNKTSAQIRDETGISDRTIRYWRSYWNSGCPISGTHSKQIEGEEVYKKPELNKEVNDNQCTITVKSLNIQTIDQLLKFAKVDTKIWEVERYVVNSWEVTMRIRRIQKEDKPETYTNYQVKAWLRKKKPLMRGFEAFAERLLNNRYTPKPYKYKKLTDHYMLEWCPYDQHHGMLAWSQEVDDDWDIKLSEEWFDLAAIDVIEKSKSYEIEQVVIPIGQDFLHLNDPTATTPEGHHLLDYDSRFGKIYETGFISLMRAVERFRKIAPVHLIWIPGNHDPQTSLTLAHALANNYMKPGTQEFINGIYVDISKRIRKCYVWGNSFIGFSHPITNAQFKEQRGVFADLFGKEWGNAIHHEIHSGHKHKIMEYSFMQADTHGSHTVIRMLPSLCASDKWHWDSGFLQKNRASASFIWSNKEGLEVQHITRITDKLRKLL